MMTDDEKALVYAKIRAHHGNGRIDDLQFQCFREELRPYVTLTAAMAAVTEYYAEHGSDGWMTAGDVNRIVRSHRSLPSEMDVTRMIAVRGLSGDAAWQFRRSLFKALSQGVSVVRAEVLASDAAERPVLDAGPSKPALTLPSGRSRSTPRRVGEGSVADLFGRVPSQTSETHRGTSQNANPTRLSDSA